MIRVLIEGFLTFLIPFVLFGIVLVIARRNPFRREAWAERVLVLAIAGIACVIAGLVLTGILAERATGIYEPAHMENGQLVPGRFR